ncbi:hypothetical protein VCHE16_3205 [Vibrio paracholerae HE-16]|nr:hypothetical protein VCHE16_3205 [Vibrio paracholerae HE-16]
MLSIMLDEDYCRILMAQIGLHYFDKSWSRTQAWIDACF